MRWIKLKNKKIISLNKLPIGKTGYVDSLLSLGNERRRMLDLGIVPNTKIEVLYKSPTGDPTAYFIRGTVIAFRKEDAEKIHVKI